MYFLHDHAPFLPNVAVHKYTILLHFRLMDAKPMYTVDFLFGPDSSIG